MSALGLDDIRGYISTKSFEEDFKVLSAHLKAQVIDCLREIDENRIQAWRRPKRLRDAVLWAPTNVWSIRIDHTNYRMSFKVEGRKLRLRHVRDHVKFYNLEPY